MSGVNNLHKLVCTLSLLASVSTLASDGVLEINQACAAGSGCFSGDTEGYPVTIDGSAGRSYQLTGDLIIPDPDTSGIFITASRVTIDLNGFEIIGAACVESASVECRPESGNGSGVTVNPSNSQEIGVSVANGSITGMGRDGIFLGGEAQVRNITATWNGFRGISVNVESIVAGNTTIQNGMQGILSEGRSIISDNVSSFNTGDGIRTGDFSAVTGNIVMANEVNGIYAAVGSRVAANTSATNGQNGITTEGSSSVQDNTVTSNQALGLNLTPTTTYQGNTLTENATGAVSDGKNQGHNFCAGTNVSSEDCP